VKLVGEGEAAGVDMEADVVGAPFAARVSAALAWLERCRRLIRELGVRAGAAPPRRNPRAEPRVLCKPACDAPGHVHSPGEQEFGCVVAGDSLASGVSAP